MERIDPYLVEIENATKERDEALDTIDDMVDTIAKGIINIAHQEDTEFIRSRWKEITGADIEE